MSIIYNYLNLPVDIVFSDDHKINYLYDASGRKLRMTITYADRTVETFNYCGGVIYHDQDLESIEFGVGRVVKKPDSHFYYQYYMTDHLGNIRQVYEYNESTQEVEVVQENHFYPYGLTMGGLNIYSGIESTHLYQGKELENKTRLNWYDFHARHFDSQLGRWHAIDPVVQFASPYVGMGNNPVIGVDPDGMFAGLPDWLMEFILNHYCGIVNLDEVEIVGDRPHPTYFTWWSDFQNNYNSCQGGGNTQWQYQNSSAPKGSGGGHGNSGNYSGPWSSKSNWGNENSAKNQENSKQNAEEIENLTYQIEEKFNTSEKATIALNTINVPVKVTTEVIDKLSGAVNNSDLVNFGTFSGKSIGLFGVGVTLISSISDGSFTVGDGFRVAIGLATVFIPYAGPIYGIIDVGVLVGTGKSATDRFGDFMDYHLGPY